MKNAMFSFIILVTLQVTALCQEESKPITIGHETTIFSNTLNEDRPLLIYLPESYEESEQSFPVIYLLDGKGHFHHTSGTVDFLSRSNRMPNCIVVGIPNTTDRTRDLTPPESAKEKRFPTSGGADNMMTFIEKELMPYINNKYRTTNYDLLIGHSFGGLFAVHAMVHHPQVFDAYLAISPSMWWDQQLLVDQAEKYLKQNQTLTGKLYMTMGNEGGAMLGGAWKLSAILEENAPKSFEWEFHIMEEEDHGSVPHRSTYNGLESLFEDWRIKDVMELYQSGGLVAIQGHFDRIREVYGSGAEKAPENIINTLGYQLLYGNQVEDAIKVFTSNVKNYSNSANTYDSLGEAYRVQGDTTEAIKNYKRSLDLNPGNTNAAKALKEMGADYKSIEVTVDEAILNRYVGAYKLAPGLTLDITLEAGYLYGKPTGEDKKRLIPMAENKFFLDGENIQVEFNQNDKNAVEGVTVSIGNQQKMQGKKVE